MGTHFFSPANVMKLLENVRGARTSDLCIASMMEWGRRIGKWTILVGNCPGFVGNRMVALYNAHARVRTRLNINSGTVNAHATCVVTQMPPAPQSMLMEGATPSQVDDAALKFGMKMGPLAMQVKHTPSIHS